MATTAVKVQAVAGRGAAAPGNNNNANILVVVTEVATGGAVTTLVQADFQVIDHFSLPGQSCGFSNNITGFNNVGTGAYQITVATHSTTPPPGGCKWVGRRLPRAGHCEDGGRDGTSGVRAVRLATVERTAQGGGRTTARIWLLTPARPPGEPCEVHSETTWSPRPLG